MNISMRMIAWLCAMLLSAVAAATERIEVLYLTGHTDKYHSWEVMSRYQVALLEEARCFHVRFMQLPREVPETTVIDFSAYDVVVLNVNEVKWPQRLKTQFEKYMRKGGGLVVVHEADNAFPEWEAFNRMIGLGGWGNRNEASGPFYYWKEGRFVTDRKSAGSAGKHGKRVPFSINLRRPEHPIVKGLPMQWLHVDDELYGDLRGPARRMEVIATAFSEAGSGGTGKEEPVLFTVRYGRGRIFHCVLGHTKRGFDAALQNVGYQIVFQRGTEWAATGKVSQPLPATLPSPDAPCLREIGR